jgi:uncharacterized membrane protein
MVIAHSVAKSNFTIMNNNYLNLMHLFAVIVFLGNIITELLWMRNSIKTKDLKIISFTIKSIIKGDKYFTLPGVVIITVSGILASTFGYLAYMQPGWLTWSVTLFIISGLAYTFKVAPLQKKIHTLTSSKETLTHFDWAGLNKLYASWNTWGLVALLTSVAAFVMMTIKISH